MRAQQDDALAAVQRLLQMLEAHQFGNALQAFDRRPATEPHFDHAHAERPEMFARERVTFRGAEIGEAQFDIAAHDRAAGTGETVGNASERPANREGRAIRQQAHEPQQAHAEPHGPGPGRPVTGQGFSLAHAPES